MSIPVVLKYMKGGALTYSRGCSLSDFYSPPGIEKVPFVEVLVVSIWPYFLGRKRQERPNHQAPYVESGRLDVYEGHCTDLQPGVSRFGFLFAPRDRKSPHFFKILLVSIWPYFFGTKRQERPNHEAPCVKSSRLEVYEGRCTDFQTGVSRFRLLFDYSPPGIEKGRFSHFLVFSGVD